MMEHDTGKKESIMLLSVGARMKALASTSVTLA